MKLYFLRHAIAADRATWKGADSERPLTANGRLRATAVAAAIARMGLKIDRLLTSPSRRARQTAEILAKRCALEDQLFVEDRLAPGFNRTRLEAILEARSSASSMLLVGHEPDFSDTIGQLIGGSRLVFKKSGLARVDVDASSPPRGFLVWLAPPKLLVGR